TYCDSATGSCLPNKCLAIQCGAGKQCVPSKATQSTDPATACEGDPCATITCPNDCWTCAIDQNTGAGSCQLDRNKCQSVNAKVGQRGGGESGCSCEVGGGAGRTGWLALGMGLMLLAARRRKSR
ncbi:MAG TPA: MYXO-CTERM sorting domain-containing protein, partial [Polyangia bacterium]|nr:MYXO-CTERM sorting domain-containing protein [Polyangia bacterium]